ncbi:MAG TPA: S9 family peptidase [Candidatus Binatia bacterium]|nr:S9 family peptidase [Candidatus Binatia bacterium]
MTTAPYGAWKSPITADLIASVAIGLGQIVLDRDDVYWSELRPTEGGRSVIVRRTMDGAINDVTPPGFNARTRVHEYGGGAFTVSDGAVYFSNFADQRVYRQDHARAPRPITPEGSWRYADGVVDRARNRLVCVREDHTPTDREAINAVVGVDLDGRIAPIVLVSGNDFYSSPRLNADGSKLAWLAWNHPNMPWDGCELWVATIDGGGAVRDTARIAGGDSESMFQPEWAADGSLYFVSDRSGWWNLYRWRGRAAEPLCEMAAEFGVPQWNFAMSTFAVAGDTIVCAYTQRGRWRLATLNPATKALAVIEVPYTDFSMIRAAGDHVVCHAASPMEAAALVRIDLATRDVEVLRRSISIAIEPADLSPPEPIEFSTSYDTTAHALYYAPRNRGWCGPPDERPPLLVVSHGGPTAATSSALNLRIQYWTSRGIAVLDVNYRGSTGYGRAYRERLNGQWGIVDVDDCVNGARYLVKGGVVDGNRLAIRGSSAGGYTTLCALTFHDLFGAGASYYGIGDLEALARDTHKFESRYEERLIGPYPARADVYRARSPVHFTDKLSCPVIFFQGLDDRVVPPNQAEAMVAALRAKRLPVAYVAFAGEGHGFRRAENIKRSLEAELYFYSRIFGVTLADVVAGVSIDNLD